jgi:maleate isomerase
MRFAARPAPPDPRPVLGLLILSSDETLEQDLRALLPASAAILHSARVENAAEIGRDSLAAMAATIAPAAASLPATPAYACIGYGCTSATAVLGSAAVAGLVRQGRACAHVATPLDAVVAACGTLGLNRLALLSPYVEEVSETLRAALAGQGVATPVFGSFAEPSEPAVARIAPEAVFDAARTLGADPSVDGVFLSCTNLPTLPVIEALEQALGKPVMSSNQALAWAMARAAGLAAMPAPVGLLHRHGAA